MRPCQRVVVAHEARVLDAVQQHVGDAQHVRELLLLDRAQGALHPRLVLGPLHVTLAHVINGAGEKAAGPAGGIEQDFAGLGINAVGHEGGDGARGVVFAGIAGGLQVVEKLLVELAEVAALVQAVEVDLVDAVDDLPHQLPGLHVVVGILEHIAHDAAAVAGLVRNAQGLQRREQLVVDEGQQLLARYAFRIGRPGTPLVFPRDRRAVVVLGELKLLVLIVDDLEEKHPAQLADALGVAIDAHVLAHDVLYGFDDGADDHFLSFPVAFKFQDAA
jgi:hypothetical protein